MIELSIPPVMYEQDQQSENTKFANYTGALCKKYLLNNKVLLVQPPQFMADSFNLKVARMRGCYAYPPTGLQCIAKALSNRSLEIDILDLNYELLRRVIDNDSFNHLNWLSILDEHLERSNPSIVGVTCISIYTDVFKSTHPLTSLLKHLRKKDKYIIITGGTIATNEYESYLEKNLCHYVIEGEGENKILFLFDYLFENKGRCIPTPGIYFKFGKKIEETKGKKDIVILRGNLIDTYRYVPIEDYNNVGSLNPFSRMAGQDKHFAGIQLNRGCRADCKFCGVTEFMGKGLRQYPVTDLLEEIHYLIKERGVRHFEVLDDDFLGYQNSGRAAMTLLEEMVKLNKKYGISWAAGNGLVAVSLTEEVLRLIRDSGCVGFRIGIESGNEKMLKRLRKPASLSLLRKTGRILQGFPEMFIGGNYIIGLFGEETFGEMLDTFRFACEINLDLAGFTTFQFTSKAVGLTEHLELKGKVSTDFIPVKDTSNREIVGTQKTASGPEVFNIAEETIPSREQIKQIWFTFNLVANYINNKNLKSDGNPEKFISWLEAVHIVYPDNPYMPLFAAIGYVLLGKKELANKYLKTTKENMKASRYWDSRFAQFGLTDLTNAFPQGAEEAEEALESMRDRYSKWIR